MTTRSKRILTAAAVGGLVLAAGVALPATAAHASKGNCWYDYPNDNSYTVWCYATPPDDYMAVVDCYPYQGGNPITKTGPWRTNQMWSTAVCPSGYEAANGRWLWDH